MRNTILMSCVVFLIVLLSALAGWLCGWKAARADPVHVEDFTPPALAYFVCPPYLGTQEREGTVRLCLHVAATGDVAVVEVIESSGQDKLDEMAADTVIRWRFKPATRGNKPVSCKYHLTLAFKLADEEPPGRVPTNQYKIEQAVP